MDPHHHVHLTPSQARHERVMQEVVARVQNSTYVLKGGSARAFVHGLDRHSTDLGFDADRHTNLSRWIRRGMQAAGVESTVRWFQDSKESLRFKVAYVGLSRDDPPVLQVDTRFRPKSIREGIISAKGVRPCTINALFRLKLDGLGVRREPRVLNDFRFIAQSNGNELDDAGDRRAAKLRRYRLFV